MNYISLSAIVEQLERCGYQTKDGLHLLEQNAAFLALKEEAQASDYLPSDKLELIKAGLNGIISHASRLTSGNAPHGVAGITANAKQLLTILNRDGI